MYFQHTSLNQHAGCVRPALQDKSISTDGYFLQSHGTNVQDNSSNVLEINWTEGR